MNAGQKGCIRGDHQQQQPTTTLEGSKGLTRNANLDDRMDGALIRMII